MSDRVTIFVTVFVDPQPVTRRAVKAATPKQGKAGPVHDQGTGVTQDEFKGSFQNEQSEQSFINNFLMIGQGPGNNFLVHENFHLAINANGDVTAVHDNLSIDCK